MSDKKRSKKDELDSMDNDDIHILLSGTLDEVIARLETIKEKYKRYHTIELDFHSGYDRIALSFSGLREETEKEKEKRLETSRKRKEAAKRREEKKEVKELSILKDLLEKHGDKLKDLL